MLIVCLSISGTTLLLRRMWLGNMSTIIFIILLQLPHSTIGSIHAVALRQMGRREDGMHWLDGCSRIGIVGRYCSGTLEGGLISDNLEFFCRDFGFLIGICCISLCSQSYSFSKGGSGCSGYYG
jgi:hypothetical protein